MVSAAKSRLGGTYQTTMPPCTPYKPKCSIYIDWDYNYLYGDGYFTNEQTTITPVLPTTSSSFFDFEPKTPLLNTFPLHFSHTGDTGPLSCLFRLSCPNRIPARLKRVLACPIVKLRSSRQPTPSKGQQQQLRR